MGLRPLSIVYCFSAEIDFRRHNLTSKVDPRAVKGNCGQFFLSTSKEIICIRHERSLWLKSSISVQFWAAESPVSFAAFGLVTEDVP